MSYRDGLVTDCKLGYHQSSTLLFPEIMTLMLANVLYPSYEIWIEFRRKDYHKNVNIHQGGTDFPFVI